MMVSDIIAEAKSLGVELIPNGNRIRVRGPDHAVTDRLIESLRRHKPALLEVLRDRQEARTERAAILEYQHGFARGDADKEARARIHLVTCRSCTHWTGATCGVGLHIGGRVSARTVRVCGFYSPRNHRQ